MFKKLRGLVAALVLSFFCSAVYAETLVLAHKDGKDYFRFRLKETPCLDQSIIDRLAEITNGQITPDSVKMQEGDIIWANDYFKSCWFLFNGKVYQMGTDLMLVQPALPLNLFKKEEII